MLYGGSIPPGHFQGHDVTIGDVFEAIGAHATGRMSDEHLAELEAVASPGAGACGGQFTANTMAMAFEVLGISPMAQNLVPAQDADQGARSPTRPASSSIDVLKRGLRPSDIITKASLENAIAAVACSGGSTNGVLHLLAVARETGVELDIDDFDRISERTPLLCDLKPGGRYVAVDLYEAGGVPVVLQRLQEAGLLHEDAITVTGETIGEHARAATETEGQRVVRPLDEPLKATGGLAILRGNLAPEGCVVKLAGHERRHHRGPARVFDGEEAAMAAVTSGGRSRPGDVVVIRNEGPAGGPGMREMLAVTAAPSSARASARTSRCSPTGASPAPPTASWSATSRPRPSAAARSRPSTTATSSRSTSTRGAWTSTSTTTRSRAASRRTSRRRTPIAPACWPSTRRSWPAPPRAPSRCLSARPGGGYAAPAASCPLTRSPGSSARNASSSALKAAGRSSIATWPVSAPDDLAGVGDQPRELVGVARGDELVLRAPDDQRRTGDLRPAGRGSGSR